MDRFFSQLKKTTDKPESTSTSSTSNEASGDEPPKKFPKGIVLGKDGKPCRSCSSFAAWAAMTKEQTSSEPTTDLSLSSVSTTSSSNGLTPNSVTTTASSPSSTPSPPPDCPPDVDTLGRHTWTLLHSMAANYPERANPTQQTEMKQFLFLFARLYPCWVCADDFRYWISREERPVLETRDAFGRWMCRAHNAVNSKLGKPDFDCNKWQERWREGSKDGHCG